MRWLLKHLEQKGVDGSRNGEMTGDNPVLLWTMDHGSKLYEEVLEVKGHL
jgi:hypothetical protein